MTGPGNRHDPKADERTQKSRDEQTSTPEHAGFPAGLGTPGHPLRVQIDSASEDYFAGFARRTDEHGKPVDPGHGFRSSIDDTKAMSQSVKQVTDELRRGVEMAQQFQLTTTQTIAAQRDGQEQANKEQRAHLEQVLRSIETTLNRQDQREQQRERSSRVPDDQARRPAGPFDDRTSLDDLGTGRPGRYRGTGGGYGPDEPPTGGGGGGGRPPRGPRGPGGPPGGWGDDRPAGDSEEPYGPELPPQMAAARGAASGNQSSRDKQRTDLGSRAVDTRVYNTSRHALRQRIERSAAEQLHQRFGEGTKRQPTLLPQYDANGDISHHILRQDGQADQRIENNDPRLGGLQKTMLKQAIVSTASAGLNAAGFAGAARALPVVGTALSVAQGVNAGLEFVGNQNRQSSFYQGIYAGNSKYGNDALGQRLQEEGYVWGNKFSALTGGLTEADARTAFQGVSQIGLKDSERTNALNFVESSYSKLGVDVQTSLKLIETSAKGANNSLAGLDKALGSVGTMARATSQNANVLYQSFAQNYQMALGMSLGANAPGMAASLTQLAGGTTRDLANVSYAPLASETSRRIIGQVAGQSYSSLEAQYAQGNTDPYTQAVDKKNTMAYQGAMNGQGQVGSVIQQEIAKRGGVDKVKNTPGAWRDIALAAMQAPGADPENLKRYLSAQGIEDVSGLTDQQVYEKVVQQQVGANSLTAATHANQEQFNQQALAPNDSPTQTQGRGFAWLTQTTGSNWVRDRVSTDPGVVAFGWGARGQKNEALAAYTQRQQGAFGDAGKGKTDPVIQSLIDKFGSQSEVGFKVQTGDGEKVVSMADAIKYYPDQLVKGTATVIGGDASTDGQAVKSIVGGAETNTTDASTTGASGTPGVSEDQWRKDNPTTSQTAKGTQAAGTIQLDMSDNLRKWFSANVSGSVTDPATEAGAQASVPPQPGGGLPR